MQTNTKATLDEGSMAQVAVRSGHLSPVLDWALRELNPSPTKHHDNAKINAVKISFLTQSLSIKSMFLTQSAYP